MRRKPGRPQNLLVSPTVTLRPVDADLRPRVAALEVEPAQRAFVGAVEDYLALYEGGVWRPLAICAGDDVVGFVMWGFDEEERSCWIGGLVVDRRAQRRGYGRAATEALVRYLRGRAECGGIALSYRPENVAARSLYASLGFVETGETVDEEIVARLRPSA